MCLILFSYKQYKDYPFVLAANRDEFYDRPTAAANYWKDHPNILAGRDLEKMGTWMGITKKGTFAALTNYRGTSHTNHEARSRGEIVSQFLIEEPTAEDYVKQIRKDRLQYNGYNLLFGNLSNGLFYYSNVSDTLMELEPGLYGLSNEFLNSNWPKVEKGKQLLETCLKQETLHTDSLFNVLKNNEIAKDEELPSTGVEMDWERLLSPLFIQSPTYGTRTSTVVTVDQFHSIKYIERTHDFKKIVENRFDFFI